MRLRRSTIHYLTWVDFFVNRFAKGSTTKHRGRDFTVGCVRFSTKSKNAHTPPEWGCEGTCVPSRSPGSTALRILHDILWYYLAKAVARCCSSGLEPLHISSWRCHPERSRRAGFTAKETNRAYPAVPNRGYDSQRGSCLRNISLHVSYPLSHFEHTPCRKHSFCWHKCLCCST